MDREQFLISVKILRKQGKTIRAIARDLGVNRGRVFRALKGLDLSNEGRDPAVLGVSDRSIFVGREEEMGVLRLALQDAMAGRGRLVMLTGEPGIGKTRTAMELDDYARSLGAQALWGRCHETRGTPPYWPWIQLVRTYIEEADKDDLNAALGSGTGAIAEIAPEIRARFPQLQYLPELELEQARFRLLDSVITFFRNAAKSQPIVLILDNLHWADASSLLLLEFFAPQLGDSHLLMLGTYRDGDLSRQHPLSKTLGELTRDPLFRRISLRRLSQEESARFIRGTSNIAPELDVINTIYAHTEGNPFFLTELVRLLVRESRLSTETLVLSRIPEGIREVIGRRLDHLSDGCDRILTVASVAGREFSLELLNRLIDGLSEDLIVDALEEALAIKVVEEVEGAPGRYRFAHVLIQQTLISELSTIRRGQLHKLIAQALEELYGSKAEEHSDELAYHLSEAITLADTWKLVKYSLMAGEQALKVYAYEQALVHFERALAAKEGLPMDDEYAVILARLGRTQSLMQNMEDALENTCKALEYFIEERNIEQAAALAILPLSAWLAPEKQGPHRLTSLIARTIEMVDPDSIEAGRLQATYGWAMGIGLSDYDAAEEAFEESLHISRRHGVVALEMRTLANAAAVSGRHIRWQQSLDYSLLAIEKANAASDLESEARARFWAAVSYYVTGAHVSAIQQATVGLARAEKLRHKFWMPLLCVINEILYESTSDWDKAREFSDKGLSIEPVHSRIIASRAGLEFQLGNMEQAWALLGSLAQSMHQSPQGDHVYLALVIAETARISNSHHLLDTARFVSESVLSSPATLPDERLVANVVLGLLGVINGDTDCVLKHYAALGLAKGTMLSSGMMSIDRVLGLLAKTIGRMDEATKHFDEAREFCLKAGYRVEGAWVAYDHAEVLLRTSTDSSSVSPDNLDTANSLVEQSLDVANELSIVPLVHRAEELLERIELLKSSPSGSYPAGLTNREVEVLRLVAMGKTNREIADTLGISLNTVIYHARNILMKTDSSNRAEAAAYAYQHGLLSQEP